MYSEWIGPALAGLLALWLGVLSFLIWKQGKFLISLFPKSGERDIRVKFEEVLKQVLEQKHDLKRLEEKLLELEKEGLGHIQKVELLRYNPYGDTGGNLSFSLASLNNEGSGYVLTSLHARASTRVFAKPIVQGKGKDIKLSKEEQEVIDKALKR